MRTPRAFTRTLASVHLPSVFNPYSDHCGTCDRANAARIRRTNLRLYLEAALDAQVKTLWIARDLGYRGGRRTGVPMTDDAHLGQVCLRTGGATWQRATRGPAVAERTAAIVWRALADVREPVLLWNIFPLHPHAPDRPASNRRHTRHERDATWPWLLSLIEMAQPTRIVAIGGGGGGGGGVAMLPVRLPVSTSTSTQSAIRATAVRPSSLPACAGFMATERVRQAESDQTGELHRQAVQSHQSDRSDP